MNNNLKDKLEDVINQYDLYTKNQEGNKEELSPANDLEDLVVDLVQVVCDEVSEFIVKDD